MAIPVESMGVIDIGIQGEHLATTIEIDVTSKLNRWPGCVVSLLIKRPGDKEPYFADTTLNGAILTWPITRIDTAVAGEGQIEVQARKGDVLDKSVTGKFKVNPSLSGSASSEMPDFRPSWVDQILNVQINNDIMYVNLIAKGDGTYSASKKMTEIADAYNEGRDVRCVVDGAVLTLNRVDFMMGEDNLPKPVSIQFGEVVGTSLRTVLMTSDSYITYEKRGLALNYNADAQPVVYSTSPNNAPNKLFYADANGQLSPLEMDESVAIENGVLKVKGGGGVSSWNDLTDKPFEAAYDALLLDQTVGFTKTDDAILGGVDTLAEIPKMEIVEGETYTVYIGDKTYTGVAEFIPMVGCCAVGNTAILGGVGGQELPFFFAAVDGSVLGSTNYLMVAEFAEITEAGNYRMVVAHGDHPLGTITSENVVSTVLGMMLQVSTETPTLSDLEKGYTIKCIDENGAEVVYTESNTTKRINEQSGSISIYMPHPDLGTGSVDEYELVEIRPAADEMLPAGTYFFTYSKHPVQSFTVNGYYEYRKVREAKKLDAELVEGGVYPITLTCENYVSNTESTWTSDRTLDEVVAAAAAGNTLVARIVHTIEIVSGNAGVTQSRYTNNIITFDYFGTDIPLKGVYITYMGASNVSGAYEPKVNGYWEWDSEHGLVCKYYDD